MTQANFQNESYYHIFNRGVEKRIVFSDKYDYIRFLESMRMFNREENVGSIYEHNFIRKQLDKESDSQLGAGLLIKSLVGTNKQAKESNSQLGIGFPNKPLVEIICYCLNQNHFHMLLKQKEENGIPKFMHKLGIGYTNYFNKKYARSGSLFQGKYKSVGIKTDSYLLYVSAYINANAEIHQIAKAEKWPWSSYLDYLGERNGTLCNSKSILQQFKNTDEYQKFT